MVEERLSLRNRIIGVILRDARERANLTKRECADALGVSASTITAFEDGRKPISLPEAEVLAYVLNLPLKDLWDPSPGMEGDTREAPLQDVLMLRHRIVGALLREARLDRDMSQGELADVLKCSTSRIAAFEYGERPIPIAELELMAQHLQVPIEHFLDGPDGPVGEWHRQQEAQRRFSELPVDVQEFVVRPANIKYLEVAMRLSRMEARELRAIAEGLLDITY
ncbi:MAG: helix-turn-helix transcriptional regulator [Chloroflexi bacterium]|nr:helix-turn-helix transcriptional regulator [Chloroflexota bacterium]